MTPNGTEILYFEKDKEKKIKRHYEVKFPGEDWRDDFPSVSTVTDTLDKPGLKWWGMRVGIDGLSDLIRRGIVRVQKLEDGQTVLVCAARLSDGRSGLVTAGQEQIEELLKHFDLDVNSVRDTAADRGTAVHEALEVWAQHGVVPDPEAWPPHERGYIVGLINFLQDAQPTPIASEVMVASRKYGYAGRFDVRLRFEKTVRIVKHRTPVKGPQYAIIEASSEHLDDLKTPKDVYDSHCEQLEAYEEAGVECGWGETNGRGVLIVAKDGTYRYVRSWGVFDDFLATLAKYKQNVHMHARYLRRND